MYDYDLIVIGGGPGGYAAAIRASQLGLRTGLVEKGEMGGTCLNRGCIPTKSLLHSAELYQQAKHGKEFGVISKEVSFDYNIAASRKDAVVKQLRSGVEYLVKKNGCRIFQGEGTIKDAHTVEVSGKDACKMTTDKILIATGSQPSRPPVPGIDRATVLDSDAVLGLKECPDSIVIIGGGVIGVEFATVFNSLGSKVTIIEMTDSLVPGVDAEISTILRQSLEKKGVFIHTGSKVLSIRQGPGSICTFDKAGKEMTIDASAVIVAAGRKPLSVGIGIEKVGVSVERGFIKVNDRMETNVQGIYAIGDVTGKAMLAHVATAQGLVAASNAAGINKKMDYNIIPSCIYTSPEIAAVGMTGEEAVKKGIDIKIGRFPISVNGKSMIMGEREGLAKVISDAETGEILGAHIIGPRATDMITEISLAMKLESTAEELADTIHPHPTVSEVIMEAVHDIEGLSIHKLK
jgi:dihydrolipoamide dehydrogenase